ncbi:MAG: ECF transporter S component [Firmicutes bacterium]|nr:ECF transporter S component [Bacillota bacterium]
MKKILSTKVLILIAVGVVFNIVLSMLGNTVGGGVLFLDTVGTIFIAAFLGPIPGILTGVLTNLINGVLVGPTEIPFLLVNGAIGLIVGLIAQKQKNFNLPIAIIVGLIIAVVAPLIGTPIAIFLFGGLTGSGMDFMIIWLKTSGQNLFSAVFLTKIVNNLIDKIGSSLLVFAVLKALPYSIIKDSILDKMKDEKSKKIG